METEQGVQVEWRQRDGFLQWKWKLIVMTIKLCQKTFIHRLTLDFTKIIKC